MQQRERREDLDKRHAEIRNKYGLNKPTNPDIQPPSRDNIFSVENEQISISLR